MAVFWTETTAVASHGWHWTLSVVTAAHHSGWHIWTWEDKHYSDLGGQSSRPASSHELASAQLRTEEGGGPW